MIDKVADFLADNELGMAALIARAQALREGAPTISLEEHLTNIEQDDQ